MRHLLGFVFLLTAYSTLAAADDPSPSDALAILTALKATVVPAKPTEADKVVKIDLSRRPLRDDQLKVIGALKSVRELNLSGPLQKAKGGKRVYAAKQITDEGIKGIAGMTELVTLELDGTHLTDAGLKHLAGMKKLKTLNLSGTKVTNDGMEELTKLASLETVILTDTKVNGDGETILKRWKLELSISR